MNKKSFPSLVRQYLGFLIDDYGFSLKEDINHSESFGEGVIVFWSKTTVVSIRLDRGEIWDEIGPSTEPPVAWLSQGAIIHFLTNEKRKFPINYTEYSNRIDTGIELMLTNYAQLLREYCEPILRGDFSWWLDACEFTLKYIQDEYRSITGLELPENEPFTVYVRSKKMDRDS